MILNKLRKLSVVHPFLFAIFPILFLFAHNIYEVPAGDLLLPIAVIITGTSILFFSLRLITKSYVKTGIITSWFLVLFFSYGHIRDLIYSLEMFDPCSPQDQIVVNRFLASLWALLFATGFFLVIKARRNFEMFTKFLNVTAITLVAISLINISVYEIKTIDLGQDKINEEHSSNDSKNLPDIYYIILDEYARASTLKEVYNYDNSEFIECLTNKGFYVASKSRCNYPETKYSIASCLNMEYFKEQKGVAVLWEMLKNSEVSQFLKSKGYHYIFVGHPYFQKGLSKYAEIYGTTPFIRMSNFASFLTRSTAIAPVVAYFVDCDHGALILSSFSTLAGIPNIKEPTFVYAHILCPHSPFVFDRNGNPIKSIAGLYPPEERRVKYLDQLIFVNKKVKALVDELLLKSDIEPIIILQADHGSRGDAGREFDILNAYFLPENGKHLLYETITPVNSFRIILNLYFDTNYDLLEDKSYFLDMTLIPPESNSD